MAQDRFELLALENKKPQEVKEPLYKQLKEPTKEDIFESIAQQQKANEDRSLISAFKRGSKAGVSGLLAGYEPEAPPEDEGWGEFLSSLAGEVVSDVPGFWAGGELGAIAGGAAGSVIPGAGTVGGAFFGGGAGALAFPSALKGAFREYRDFAKSNKDLSFGDFLERAGRVSKETGKSAVVGAATSGMSKLLPVLRRIPKLNKLLNTKAGKLGAEIGLEYTGLTGTQAALEGELPSAKQAVGNLAVIGGMRAAKGIGSKIKEYRYRPESGFESPKVESSFKKTVRNLLPEEMRGLLKTPEQKAKNAKYEEVLQDYVGSKNAKTVESAFNWRDRQTKYEAKGGKFTPKQLSEMKYYAQRTGNPEYGFEDSYTDVAQRLPKHARAFVDEVVRPHLKDSLKFWNEHPITKNIKPRAGLEEYYLPGMYSNTSKAKLRSVESKLRTKFKIKNPFSNTKSFLTYNEAALEAGLKPLHDNIVDLMKHFDKVNIKLMHNAELLNMVKEFQKASNDNIIVTAEKPSEYARARSKGYVEFEDPFLRSYKDENGKYRESSKPALVEPEFAKTFKGVFSKEAFKPDNMFLRGHDKLMNQINYMRVAGSLFHYGAEMESILGQRGLKGLNLIKMARDGRALRSNKEFMMDAAKHGMKVSNRLGMESVQKANSLIERGMDYLDKNANSPKAVKLFRKATGYMFDEFIPNAKVVTYEESVKREIADFKKKNGRSPSPQEAKAMKRTVAEFMNNIFGGQNWETSILFRDPKARKRLRRTLAFPDWTISTIKQAKAIVMPGLEGRLGQKYAIKYALGVGGITSLLRFLFGGIEQTDKEKKSLAGIAFNPKKGLDALKNVRDPERVFYFPLPDAEVRYGPGKDEVFNLGRDADGRRISGHYAKQALEIKGWFTHPLVTLFNKANPIFQQVYKNIVESTPSKYGKGFAVDSKRIGRDFVPFQGKEGLEKWKRRAIVFAKEFIPFGFRDAFNMGGVTKWIKSFGSMFPIGKEYPASQADLDIKSAFRSKDKNETMEKLIAIRSLLKADKYTDKQINSRIKRNYQYVIDADEIEKQFSFSNYVPKIKAAIKNNSTKEINKLKKELMFAGGYTEKWLNQRINKLKKNK